MKELLNRVQATVSMEYERTAKKFGKANNGPHESYAVILEEFQEATDCATGFAFLLERFWHDVKNDCTTTRNGDLKEMQDRAEHAAAEWIQVAAMCHKATIKKETGGGE